VIILGSVTTILPLSGNTNSFKACFETWLVFQLQVSDDIIVTAEYLIESIMFGINGVIGRLETTSIIACCLSTLITFQ